MPNTKQPLPEWERLLSAAAHLQRILPGAVLVGGTAVATHVHHRLSYDADHVLNDLRGHFDEVLAQLETVAGWQTARVRRPVLILGTLDGIETGVRQLIRESPLETTTISIGGETVTLPSPAEMLRIIAQSGVVDEEASDRDSGRFGGGCLGGRSGGEIPTQMRFRRNQR